MKPADYTVIGLGRFGASVALTLMQRGFTVLGIDSSIELVQRYAAIELVQRYAADLTQTVKLDSTDELALAEIDIQACETVIVAIGASFESSLMTTVALRNLKVKTILCKALTKVHRDLLITVGATRVLLPEYEAGERLANELAHPGILEGIAAGEDRICRVRIPPVLIGLRAGDVDFNVRFGVECLGVIRDGKVHRHAPKGWVFGEGETLLVMGPESKIARMMSWR